MAAHADLTVRPVSRKTMTFDQNVWPIKQIFCLSFLFYTFYVLNKRVKLVLKLKFNFPFWPIISKNIGKKLKKMRNIETLKTLTNFSIYWLRNIEFNTMLMLKIKTLKTYSISMSMSIFSMFFSMFNVDLQTLSRHYTDKSNLTWRILSSLPGPDIFT